MPSCPGGSTGVTRRAFLATSAGAIGAATMHGPQALAITGVRRLGPGKVDVTIKVNGKERKLSIEPRVTLLRALRNHLDITGPKQICDRGTCGGCSVLVDGTLVNSCMMLALDAAGKAVTTAEGLMKGDQMSAIQYAFCLHDALQCGFCTPGMVMACKALLDRHRNPKLEQIKEGLSGNICRCGTYTRIFEAVQTAAGMRRDK